MINDLDKIKKLVTEDLVVDAVELQSDDTQSIALTDNLEQALSHFDDDGDTTYAHYVIRVKKEKPAEPFIAQTSTETIEEISMQSLVEETLQMTQEPMQGPSQEPTQDPYTPEFLLENAKILEENKEYELARNIYLSLVKQGLHIPKCLANIARTFEKENQLAEAIQSYQDAIAYSSDSELYKNLAALQIRMGNDTEACETLIRALGLPQLSDDEIFEFQKSLGNCYTRLGNYLKAEHHYWKAFELNATSDTLQVNVGSLALQKNDFSAAQKHFEKALDLNAKNDKAISGLGMVYLAQGNIRRAHDQFVKSLELNLNSNLGAVYNLVKCAYELKKFDDAAKILRRYIETHPINTNILYSYSGILYHLEEHQRALAEVEKILLHSPGHVGAIELKELISKKAPTNQ